jgi:hypothetical protein
MSVLTGGWRSVPAGRQPSLRRAAPRWPGGSAMTSPSRRRLPGRVLGPPCPRSHVEPCRSRTTRILAAADVFCELTEPRADRRPSRRNGPPPTCGVRRVRDASPRRRRRGSGGRGPGPPATPQRPLRPDSAGGRGPGPDRPRRFDALGGAESGDQPEDGRHAHRADLHEDGLLVPVDSDPVRLAARSARDAGPLDS